MKKIFFSGAAIFMLALGSLTTTVSLSSCTKDDDSTVVSTLEEKIDFTGLNVVAQANGKVLIDGKIVATAKVKSLVLSSDSEGKNVIVDLLASGDQEKVKKLNEEGEKTKQFEVSIPTAAVDVQTMYLVGKTKGDKKASSAITETISYKIGAANSETCSYLSITENKAVNFEAAKANPSTVEVIAASSSDGNTVEGIKRASQARNTDIKTKCAKCALFQDGKAVADDGKITDGGVIITAAGAICKVVKIETTSTSTDAQFEGITMKAGLGAIKKVDVSAFTFSK